MKRLSPEDKRERMQYLRYRVRIIVYGAFFIRLLQKNVDVGTQRKQSNQKLKLIFEHEDDLKKPEDHITAGDVALVIWKVFMSILLWFNLLSIPMIMLWPDLN